MDLWDLTKMLFRRWYVALPMLVVSIAVVALTSHSVRPDYSATGHVVLVPPALVNRAPNDTSAIGKVHNPWDDLGLNAMSQAVMVKVQDKQVIDGLAANGFTDKVTLTKDNYTPLITIEAVGVSPAQATQTVQRVIQLLTEDVASAQTQYGVAPGDSISLLALDKGDSVTAVTSKEKRVLVAAAAVGLLVTTGGTIAVDALLRRRTLGGARRAARADDPRPRPADAPAPGVEPVGDERGERSVRHRAGGARMPDPVREELSAVLAGGRDRLVNNDYHRGEGRTPIDDEPTEAPVAPAAVASDATVVLPRVSERSWSGGEEKTRHWR